MRDLRWPHGAYAAAFDSERPFTGALESLRDQGYERIETYSPYHVPAVDAVLGQQRSFLPALVFVAGLAGAIAGYWIQWFANAVSYPLNIGGRPAHATPAFLIPTFEATILSAGLMAFGGLYALLRLPRPWHPMFEVEGFERASIDHYWIAIDADDPRADATQTPASLEALAAVRVARVPPSEGP
jgi:hypothetical protein